MCSDPSDNNAKGKTDFEPPGMRSVTVEEFWRQVVEGKERYRAWLAALPLEERQKREKRMLEMAEMIRRSRQDRKD